MLKILIVDDEPVSRTMLRNFLQKYGRCDEAGDGAEALTLFDKAVAVAPYDLVFLDIFMPHINGQETLVEFRKIEKMYNVMKKTKIFMLSASTSKDDVSNALKRQCDDFIHKPFQPEDLVKLLKMHGLT